MGWKFQGWFQGKQFSLCLYSDMPSALENTKVGRELLIATGRHIYVHK